MDRPMALRAKALCRGEIGEPGPLRGTAKSCRRGARSMSLGLRRWRTRSWRPTRRTRSCSRKGSAERDAPTEQLAERSDGTMARGVVRQRDRRLRTRLPGVRLFRRRADLVPVAVRVVKPEETVVLGLAELPDVCSRSSKRVVHSFGLGVREYEVCVSVVLITRTNHVRR